MLDGWSPKSERMVAAAYVKNDSATPVVVQQLDGGLASPGEPLRGRPDSFASENVVAAARLQANCLNEHMGWQVAGGRLLIGLLQQVQAVVKDLGVLWHGTYGVHAMLKGAAADAAAPRALLQDQCFAYGLRPGVGDPALPFVAEGLSALGDAAADRDTRRVERCGIGCGYDTYSTSCSGGRNDQTKQDTLDLHDHSIVKLMNARWAAGRPQRTWMLAIGKPLAGM